MAVSTGERNEFGEPRTTYVAAQYVGLLGGGVERVPVRLGDRDGTDGNLIRQRYRHDVSIGPRCDVLSLRLHQRSLPKGESGTPSEVRGKFLAPAAEEFRG